MVDQFLGEIKLVGFNFAPTQWAMAAGQLLPLAQNAALFSLFGTMYGGDGRATFGLPDLQGRAVGHVGPNVFTAQGEKLGEEYVTLNDSQIPAHNHMVEVSAAPGTGNAPLDQYLGTVGPLPGTSPPPVPLLYAPSTGQLVPLYNGQPDPVIGPTGGGTPHQNMQPFLVMTYIVALYGIFPTRS